jgi:hypothetical protein
MADSTSSSGKRAGEHTAAEQAQPKKKKLDKPILVVFPGASGKLAKDVEDLLIPRLREMFDVRVRSGSWNTGNVKAAGNTSAACSLGPQGPPSSAPAWYIMGASFGCRVAAAVVSEQVTATPPSLILTGYPAYGPKHDSRLGALTELPETARVMFISGDKDEFIDKQVPAGHPKGQALFEDEIIPSLQCSAQVHMVGGAGHTTVPSAKGKKAEACEQMIGWIKDFANL